MNKKQGKMNTNQTELENRTRQHHSDESKIAKNGYKEQELVNSRNNLKR